MDNNESMDNLELMDNFEKVQYDDLLWQIQKQVKFYEYVL